MLRSTVSPIHLLSAFSEEQDQQSYLSLGTGSKTAYFQKFKPISDFFCNTYPRANCLFLCFLENLWLLLETDLHHKVSQWSLIDMHGHWTMRIYPRQTVQNASAPWDISLKTPSLGWSIFHHPMMGFRHATQRLAIFCHCWGTEVWQTRTHPKQFYQ